MELYEYEKKEHITKEELELYLSELRTRGMPIPNRRERIQAAELKIRALNVPSPTSIIERTMTDSQLYTMGDISWVKNKTLQYIRVYITGRNQMPKALLDPIMNAALSHNKTADELKQHIFQQLKKLYKNAYQR